VNRTISVSIAALVAAAIVLAQGPPPVGGGGDRIWRRNAFYGEALTFDSCLGHQPNNGQYHYHATPICLRAQLGDNVVTLRTSRTGSAYAELTSGLHHSPILGWALDGYPIYGPYGYSVATDPASPVKRIKSGFRLRSIATRTTLPDWSLPNHTGVPQALAASKYGPDVSPQFPLGRYLEDFEWVAGLGDLDQYNGRLTKTPEFPQGTYAYYTTLDDTGVPAFPYIISGQFYGTPNGNFPNSVTVSTTDYFNNGIFSPLTGPINPAISSWSTKYSAKNATIVSGFDPSAGPVTTWPGTNALGVHTSGSVTTPTPAEAQRIRYSGASVYVTANALAGYQMGPWFSSDMTAGVFSNFPSAANTTFQLPLFPSFSTTAKSSTGGGPQGMWVNGVYVFNFIDGASYTNATGTDQGGGNTPSLLAAISSAASFEQGPQAPGSIVIANPFFFTKLPASITGTTVSVTDSSGSTTQAQVLYASEGQMNILMPNGLATGAGTVAITSATGTINSKINIQQVYPNLFMLNATALAAAYITRVHLGQQTFEQVYQLVNGNVVAGPIALNGDQVYLSVYGSGLGSATSATATIGGVSAFVTYAAHSQDFAGVDQYNVLIPASLAGRGKVDLIVTAGAKPSNPVNVTIQ
jgi:uncharacterized protein (TIGR03437 family)